MFISKDFDMIKKFRVSWDLFLPIFVGLTYLFLYVPIIILVAFSFNNSLSSYKWNGFTFEWYKELFSSSQIWTALTNSLIVALSSVFLCLLISLLAIWCLLRKKYKLFDYFSSIVLIPEIAIAVSLLTLFTFLKIPLGLNTLIVGHTLLGLGFSFPIIYNAFKDVNKLLIEASLDLGASMRQTFFRIVLPILYPAFFSAALLVFILSIDDFLISFFCTGPTSQTLSLYIFAMIRGGLSPVVNALSTLILIFSSVCVLLYSFITLKMER